MSDTPTPSASTGKSPVRSTRFRRIFLGQLENGLLAIGGLVALVSSFISAHVTEVAITALLIAAIGKAAPSLYLYARVKPDCPFPSEFRHPYWPALPEIGDSCLVALGFVGLVFYLSWSDTSAFLFFVGFGFALKALIDLGELALLSSQWDRAASKSGGPIDPNKSSVSLATRIGAGTVEGVALAALGLTAIVVVHISGPTYTSASAIGIAAIFKAFPSFIAMAVTASSSTG